MRILTISSDWNIFNEDSAVARRQRLQASTVDRFDVFVPHGPRATVHIAGNGVMRGFGPGKFSGMFRMLVAARNLQKPDIVSSQDPFFLGFLAWLVAIEKNAKLHIQVHTDLFDSHFANHSMMNRVRVILARFILKRADCVRVVSERIEHSLETLHLSIPISVLPVFIDTGIIDEAEPIARRKEYPTFEKMLLVVSRLESEKNVAVAIRAMPQILKAHPRMGLIVIGDGSARAALEVLVREQKVDGHVIFAGAQKPYGYFKAADAVLSTSDYEGYGMVTVEALYAGCPVISFDTGVAREAGAIIATPDTLVQKVIAILSEGRRGKLSFALPSEAEYRDLWRAQMALTLRPDARAAASDKVMATRQPLVGFVGQGWIGKNFADDFERRGQRVVRYALEEPYRSNKDKIKECDIVFIAVPTPTTPDGFDLSIVREALRLLGKGSAAVIKSTMTPGSTASLQKEFPDIAVMHSPEFLREATAEFDAARPDRNIIGIVPDSDERRARAVEVLRVLPPAPFEIICTSTEAEIIKYAGNGMLYLKVIFANLLYDLAEGSGADYNKIREALAADPRIGRSHLDPIHVSGHHGAKLGRGAGGHCFIKDFAALRMEYEKMFPNDAAGVKVFRALETKNAKLLMESGKDIDLLKSVYGTDVPAL